MNNRQRILETLAHREPDKIPYQIHFTQAAKRKMAEHFGDPDFFAKLGNCLIKLNCEPEDGWREVRSNLWQDAFGVHWDRSVDKDIGVVCNRVVTPERLDDYAFPDPDDPTRYAGIQSAAGVDPDCFYVVKLGFSLFERAWTMTGMTQLLMAMATDPDFVHRLLDRILEFNLRIIDNACRYPIDALQFGDDWGQQTGLIMGLDRWREFIMPRFKKMCEAVHARKKFVFLHSCGKVDELFPDLIECGLDIFNPFQPEVMDVFEMKRRWGDRLTFNGGISTQQTLPHGTVEQVREEVRRLLEVVGQSGGYIASPAHDIPGDARPENVAAMIEELQNQ